MPHRELVEWMDEYRREPWGPWRDNVHAALICAVMANAFRGKDSRPFTYEDFMILDAETAEKRKAEMIARGNRALVQALTAAAKVH